MRVHYGHVKRGALHASPPCPLYHYDGEMGIGKREIGKSGEREALAFPGRQELGASTVNV